MAAKQQPSEQTNIAPSDESTTGSVEERPISTARRAMVDGASDARQRVAELVPATGALLTQTLYGGCYCISYTVVFPTVLIASLFPRNNVLGEGFSAGAQAAGDRVSQIKARRVARKLASKERSKYEAAMIRDGVEVLATA